MFSLNTQVEYKRVVIRGGVVMSQDLNEWISQSIVSFVENSRDNLLERFHEKAWDKPLVGFSRGDDELYGFYKKDIGSFYLLPKEFLEGTYPGKEFLSEEITVISWVLPHTEKVKEEQRKDRRFPTERAALSRSDGENFNRKIAEVVVSLLEQEGYPAVSPMLSPLWQVHMSEKYSNASNWSERHTAHICGLGTFSLTDTLITPVGKAMRCGSVIAGIQLKPTERKYTKFNEYCLYYKNGSCLQCVKRCPANAISEKGHDKAKCMDYQTKVTNKYCREVYGLEMRYCGICQFGVPCESRIP